MTVVVGTAGHIDHGKTALLRALTGIDADRLPEERRRGMTIDVGYAHIALPDGSEIDFVDVPGHDRLVGNMLVGAGEIDAAMLVVAADDGPRAQTLEHLELLDALAIRHGIAVITKVDVVDRARAAEVRDAVERLLAPTSLAGSPLFAVSSIDGEGIDALRDALVELRDRVVAAAVSGGEQRTRLAIDRAFTVKGRGIVVTGTLRGGPLARGATLRIVPSAPGASTIVRAREVQVHGRMVETAGPGRTAINVAGVDGGADALHRGMVLTDDPAVESSDRLLVRLAKPLPDRTRVRVHLGTASVDGAVGRSGRDDTHLDAGAVAVILRLAGPVAVAPGDHLVLRRASGPDRVVGGRVLDVAPPRGISRRRQSPNRVNCLAGTVAASDAPVVLTAAAARLDLHGALIGPGGHVVLADDVAAALADVVLTAIDEGRTDASGRAGVAGRTDASDEARQGLGPIRARAARALRRMVTIERADAVAAVSDVIDWLVADGRLLRDGDRLRLPGTDAPAAAYSDPNLAAAMDRLERALALFAPPSLTEASRAVGCPSAGIRELERAGRIVVLGAGLAYAASTYQELQERALALAMAGPLTPAALRDATGTSRKYVMAILEDLDRRGILRRTDAGHVPGPRAALESLRGLAVGAAARALADVATVPLTGPATALTTAVGRPATRGRR